MYRQRVDSLKELCRKSYRESRAPTRRSSDRPLHKSFPGSLARSGLIENQAILAEVRRRFESNPGKICASQLADIVGRGLLTPWQIDLLNRGKYKNYFVCAHKLVGLIAVGASASIYSAQHTTIGTERALKIFPPFKLTDPASLEWIQNQAKVAATGHPNIAELFDMSRDPKGFIAIVREKIDGCTLREVAESTRPIPLLDVAAIIGQVAAATAWAHQNGNALCAISPTDVMLDAMGQVKVLMPCLSWAEQFGGVSPHRFFDGSIAQARTVGERKTKPRQEVDPSDDVHDLGRLLYYLLTAGQPPASEGPSMDAPVLRILRPDAPDILVEIAESAVTLTSSHSPLTAAKIAEEMEQFVAESPAL